MSTKSLQVMSHYSTNLTDKQWQVTEKILDPHHRKRKYPLRETMNAIMYIVETGCQEYQEYGLQAVRMLPPDIRR